MDIVIGTKQGPDAFDTMLPVLQAHFDAVQAANGPHLFTVDTGVDLYEVYLANLPPDQRTYHTCHCCKQFINRYGSLASVAADGSMTPAMWDSEGVPELYRASIDAMAKAVGRGKVRGVFLSKEPVWGTPLTGVWTHFAIKPSSKIRHNSLTMTPGQAMAKKREDFLTLNRGLVAYNRATVAQALTFIEAEALYRPEKVEGPARFLLALYDARENRRGAVRNNVTWLAVAGAPVGFCQPRSTVISTLLDDIVAKLPFEAIKSRFAAKLDPSLFRRAQVAPKAGNIAQAEKLVEQMGIVPSLQRRFARFDDIQTIWTPSGDPRSKAAQPGGVFNHLLPKGDGEPEPIAMSAQKITWVKFVSTVLPRARKIEVYLAGKMNFCALVTASDKDAPPILQWDSTENRNPVSWYVYKGGSNPERWNKSSHEWARVTAVTLQPSMWAGEDRFPNQGQSAILIVDGARDTKNGSLALFDEILRSDMHAVRSTIEAHSNSRSLDGADEASACGIRVGEEDSNANIRVTTDLGVVVYNIDRWN